MRVNKQTLLWAIKKSSSIEEVARRMGRPPEDEEAIMYKMLQYYPDAENFLSRNEDDKDMREGLASGDWVLTMRARLDFIGATARLIKAGLITKRDVEGLANRLEFRRNGKVAAPAKLGDEPVPLNERA